MGEPASTDMPALPVWGCCWLNKKISAQEKTGHYVFMTKCQAFLRALHPEEFFGAQYRDGVSVESLHPFMLLALHGAAPLSTAAAFWLSSSLHV